MMLPTGNKNANRTARPFARAFTLVELILVMAILVVVISVAAPSLSGFFHGRTLDSEARRLLALTRYGQSRAVYEGVPMLLWVDAKGGAYGLEEEYGYTEEDTKAVEFNLDDELEVSVVQNAAAVLKSRPVTSGSTSATRNKHRDLPAIRFQSDGTISETSPETVRLVNRAGDTLQVVIARNNLSYEIETPNSRLARASR